MCGIKGLEEALAYFTCPSHAHSFELLAGKGHVILSAPHAVLQTRGGCIKQAERFTGVLCRLLNARQGVPCIYKSRHMNDDANHDSASDYREALCAYIRANDIRYALDLHQLSPLRPMALCIGTGRGQNLRDGGFSIHTLSEAFSSFKLTPITLDDPFAAASAHTVSATVAASCDITALQLELNTKLLLLGEKEERFQNVLEALERAIAALNGVQPYAND